MSSTEATAVDGVGSGIPLWRRIDTGDLWRGGGLVIVLVLLVIAGAITRPAVFLTSNNLFNILSLGAVIGVVTVGMTFVIITSGIDLSVGSVLIL